MGSTPLWVVRCFQLLGLVGGEFDEGAGVCGAVLSVRYHEDNLSVWFSDADDSEAKSRVKYARTARMELLGCDNHPNRVYAVLCATDLLSGRQWLECCRYRPLFTSSTSVTTQSTGPGRTTTSPTMKRRLVRRSTSSRVTAITQTASAGPARIVHQLTARTATRGGSSLAPWALNPAAQLELLPQVFLAANPAWAMPPVDRVGVAVLTTPTTFVRTGIGAVRRLQRRWQVSQRLVAAALALSGNIGVAVVPVVVPARRTHAVGLPLVAVAPRVLYRLVRMRVSTTTTAGRSPNANLHVPAVKC
jgi:hypothetical protein